MFILKFIVCVRNWAVGAELKQPRDARMPRGPDQVFGFRRRACLVVGCLGLCSPIHTHTLYAHNSDNTTPRQQQEMQAAQDYPDRCSN